MIQTIVNNNTCKYINIHFHKVPSSLVNTGRLKINDTMENQYVEKFCFENNCQHILDIY